MTVCVSEQGLLMNYPFLVLAKCDLSHVAVCYAHVRQCSVPHFCLRGAVFIVRRIHCVEECLRSGVCCRNVHRGLPKVVGAPLVKGPLITFANVDWGKMVDHKAACLGGSIQNTANIFVGHRAAFRRSVAEQPEITFLHA